MEPNQDDRHTSKENQTMMTDSQIREPNQDERQPSKENQTRMTDGHLKETKPGLQTVI
jgi:hypothetical protein